MRVAVIGAGIVGVTTAFELACDGHAVTVFERRGSVAEETSFAHAGVVSPGMVAAWPAAGMPGRVLQQLLGRHAALRLARPLGLGHWGWLWRWWRAGRASVMAANHQRLFGLARYSQQRLDTLTHDLHLEYEHAQGQLLLLRTARDVARARVPLKLLAELGAPLHLIDAAQARRIEPGLQVDTPLQAAVHLPGTMVGNCRQFAHLLRNEAQGLGAVFRFQRSVQALGSGPVCTVLHQATDGGAPAQSDPFDATVVCAAIGATELLEPLGLRLPLAPLHGHSITAPLRLVDGYPNLGPAAAVTDGRYQVTISRIGQRVRVAGGAGLGGRQDGDRTIQNLHKVLDDWFPGCIQPGALQTWQGARPQLPDGAPVLGASGAPGIWLNLGHGGQGWALACGSARVLADQLAGRAPEIDTSGLDIGRFQR